MLTIQGSERFTGSVFSRRSLSRRSSLASRSPWLRNTAVSWPPTETIGTIGTPASRASLMKPLRPAKSIRFASQVGRFTSQSPPG